VELHGHVCLLAAHELGIDDPGDRHGIVQRRRREPPDVAVAVAKEHQQPHDGLGQRCPEAVQPLQHRLCRQRLVRHVEPAHRDREPAREHDVGRFGVHVDVELGERLHVPHTGRAAHQHDLAHTLRQVRIGPEQEGDVRERPGRHERHGLRGVPQQACHQLNRVLRGQRHVRGGELGAVQPRLAVHVRRRTERPHERAGRARGNGNVPDAGHGANRPGVVRGAVERAVPGHRRDREQVDPRVRSGDQDRHHVVMAGITVEERGNCRHRRDRDEMARAVR
jgi:hypothetical protein